MKHIVWIIANNTSAPYFNWFAEKCASNPQIKLTFICLHTDKPKMIEEVGTYGYVCHWIPYDYHQRKTGLINAAFKLYKLFKTLKPDVIHTHLFDDSLAGLIAGKLAGVKQRVITKGDTGFHYNYTPKWVIFDKLNNALATNIVAISSESKAFILEKEKANQNKVTVIHHGLPVKKVTEQIPEVQAKFREEWNLTNKIVIGTISRFIDWKGYKNIVAAAEIITAKHKDLVFVFVGQGQQKEEIKQLVIDKKLSDVIRISEHWIEPKNIPSLFGIFNVYLHAAHSEPFGFVIAEAMLNSVAVVSTRTGAAADGIEHKKSGYLCHTGSPSELADGIDYMLTNNSNNKIGLEGKTNASRLFNIDVMYEKHLALYKL